MLVLPVIEMQGGRVVHAAFGATAEREAAGDPRDVARRWAALGFRRLHVVDLDAAVGRDSSRDALRDLLHDGAAPVQACGGIASAAGVRALLDDGAGWVVVGPGALDHPDWLAEAASANPAAILLAMEVRERRVVAPGGARGLPRAALDLVEDLARDRLALGGLLVTPASPGDADLPLFEDLVETSEWPVFAAGTIETLAHLRALEDRGVAGALVGTALSAGMLDARLVADEFAH